VIESVPLPDIHSAFLWFAKAKYFTTLDLNQAYYQIPLAKLSKPVMYQYTHIPFGNATEAQVLTHLLNCVFQDLESF
jgi:hypothetical protein